jgi:D-alanyl-D-alanine carboxypeptidase
MIKLLAIPLAVLSFHSVVRPLSAPVRSQILAQKYWHQGCPVSLDDLRVLTVNHWGFDGRVHAGQLIVNKSVAGKLATVFGRLYELRFPIREMRVRVAYGPNSPRDESGSFDCRQAVPSPCTGGKGTGHWSMHAYGEAVDIDPRENPYVGCGMSRDKTAVSYMKRSNVRPGMVTRSIYRKTFAEVGWGWGGLWSGSTKDYMHFSVNGH